MEQIKRIGTNHRQFKKIGSNCNITANNIEIGKNVIIGDNVNIVCDTFKLGDNTILGNNININCKSFISDEWLFMWDGVEVGRGGSYSPNSNVIIGKHVGIFEKTIINPSEKITIGDNVGIGSEVMIWTHGAWLDVMQGFPADFGPVKIGNDVWLPARSIVLPNVEIGDNTVIGIGSIVNKDIPAGSLAAGSPCKVIKENYYPRKLSNNEKEKIIEDILEGWYKLHDMKGIDAKAKYVKGQIILIQGDNQTIYDVNKKIMFGYENNISEDLRDYLRRRGIKIFTQNPFKSIK
jgi:acetyltransferase-like isoleucine patch superfamily enzyme